MKLARLAPVLLAGALALATPAGATVGPVTEQLARDVQRVFATLADPDLKADAGARRRAVRAIAREVFDLPEMAARSLGPHWQRRDPGERVRFAALMGPLVESHLLLLEGAAGTPIDYLGEVVDGDRALVRSRVGTPAQRGMTLDYRLVRRGERWMVYDVLVDDVSLVDNYRAQFQKVIRKASYEELVRKLSGAD